MRKAATANNHLNGDPIGGNRKGSIVLVTVDAELAPQMRRVVFPAIESGPDLKAALDRRAAIVVYRGPSEMSRTQAGLVASDIERHCHADRVGTLDIREMGFDALPGDFLEWWTEANGIGHYDSGADFLRVAETRAEWRHRSPAEVNGHAAQSRAEIEITTQRHVVLAQALWAITRDEDLFCRGESLGVVVREEGDTVNLPGGVELKQARGSLRFVPLTAAVLGCRSTRVASFYRSSTDRHGEIKTIDVHPPDWLIAAILEHRHWPGVRHLLTITQCPYVLPDGSLARPGFDAATGTLYQPSFDLPELPDAPSKADAVKAVDVLLDLVRDFPFEDPFSFAVFLAYLLTAIQRPAIAGPVPGFAFVGNAAGLGKGLLINIGGILVLGSDVATRTYPVDPVEAAKVKLALALAAVPIVHFDNLTEGGSYGGGALDSALTSTTTSDRILGQSRDSGSVPLRPVWTLSGNNVSPAKDADRRWLPCNLKTTLEKPYEREDIRQTNLRQHVLERRGELVAAALVILKAHALAGRSKGSLGSYEEWDSIVRGAVMFATGMDCLVTQRRGANEKPERLDKAALLLGWREIDPEGEGKTVEEAISLADEVRLGEGGIKYPTLRSALINLSRDNKLPSVRTVSYRLRAIKDTPIDKMRFETCGENRNHQKLWRVVACEICEGCEPCEG